MGKRVIVTEREPLRQIVINDCKGGLQREKKRKEKDDKVRIKRKKHIYASSRHSFHFDERITEEEVTGVLHNTM